MALFNVNETDLVTPTVALFNIKANERAFVRRKVGSTETYRSDPQVQINWLSTYM